MRQPNAYAARRAAAEAASPGRLIETAFPYKELSLLARKERRAADPTYQAHRWWARRPASVFRGILLAATMSPTDADEFWTHFSKAGQPLRGGSVYDPFMG